MTTPAQLLNTSAVRYQKARSRTLEFWDINGRYKNCLNRADIKQLLKQQINIDRVLIPRLTEVMRT
jgi:hypothetical protein